MVSFLIPHRGESSAVIRIPCGRYPAAQGLSFLRCAAEIGRHSRGQRHIGALMPLAQGT